MYSTSEGRVAHFRFECVFASYTVNVMSYKYMCLYPSNEQDTNIELMVLSFDIASVYLTSL